MRKRFVSLTTTTSIALRQTLTCTSHVRLKGSSDAHFLHLKGLNEKSITCFLNGSVKNTLLPCLKQLCSLRAVSAHVPLNANELC